MFSDFNFVDYVVIFFGVLYSLKRVAQMERYHELRVIILTVIFGVIVFFFIMGLGESFDDHTQYDCPPEYFCQTEM